jgi:hypothetical protein
MATTRSFQDMLNEYLPNELLQEEMIKRDWLLKNVQKDDNWKGGKIIVPFIGAEATSAKFGGLTAENDVAEFEYVRGSIDAYKELWGTLKFQHTDLIQHDGKVKESTFIRILPDQVDMFMNYMKMLVSINMMAGPHFAKVLDDTNAATGILVIDRIDRLSLNQKVVLKDNNSSEASYYVIAIDVNAQAVTLSASRKGAAANLSAFSVAQEAKLYHDGVIASGVPTNMFTSLKSALLSAANGGSADLHGKTKLLYPYLQAVNINGSDITANNILEKLFTAFSRIRILAKGGSFDKCVVSYKHLGNIMKAIETQKGAFKVTPTTQKASIYGWTEIELVGVQGSFTIVGIQEMDDDVIMFLSMNAFTFRSNGMFRKRTAPDGKQYYEIRTTSGYAYLLDVCLFGELEVTMPSACAIIHGISY